MKPNRFHRFFRKLLCPRMYAELEATKALLNKAVIKGEILQADNNKLHDMLEKMKGTYDKTIQTMKTRGGRRQFKKKINRKK